MIGFLKPAPAGLVCPEKGKGSQPKIMVLSGIVICWMSSLVWSQLSTSQSLSDFYPLRGCDHLVEIWSDDISFLMVSFIYLVARCCPVIYSPNVPNVTSMPYSVPTVFPMLGPSLLEGAVLLRLSKYVYDHHYTRVYPNFWWSVDVCWSQLWLYVYP